MTECPEVVVVGSCMTDLISYVPRLPKLGETVHGSVFSKGFGGKGANQCVMAARLGAQTALIAKVGDDTFGHETIHNLKANGISDEHVLVTKDAASGVASITVDDQGENVIVIVSGANHLLSTADVLKAESLLTKAAVLVCQLEVPIDTTLTALKLGKKHGAITIFNVAPAVTSLSADFYEYTDILCLNETEAEMLTGKAVTDLTTGYQVVELLQSYNPGCVVLTMGGQGVLFTDFLSATKEPIKHIPAESVQVVDTTGAGDAFVGALSYYLACHPALTFFEMIRRCGIIAGHTVSFKGTQASYQLDKISKDLLTS